MTDMPHTESGNQTQTGHRPWCPDWQRCDECREIARRYYPRAIDVGEHEPWCHDWQQCAGCREIARRYYPSSLTPEQRVAQFFGGDGDSHSAYRAGQDHWFLCIVVIFFDACGQVFRSIDRLIMRRS